MTFIARPATDWCPTIGRCELCGANICDECGGDASPATCGDGEIHCSACVPECQVCTNAEDDQPDEHDMEEGRLRARDYEKWADL